MKSYILLMFLMFCTVVSGCSFTEPEKIVLKRSVDGRLVYSKDEAPFIQQEVKDEDDDDEPEEPEIVGPQMTTREMERPEMKLREMDLPEMQKGEMDLPEMQLREME